MYLFICSRLLAKQKRYRPEIWCIRSPRPHLKTCFFVFSKKWPWGTPVSKNCCVTWIFRVSSLLPCLCYGDGYTSALPRLNLVSPPSGCKTYYVTGLISANKCKPNTAWKSSPSPRITSQIALYQQPTGASRGNLDRACFSTGKCGSRFLHITKCWYFRGTSIFVIGETHKGGRELSWFYP